VRGRKKRAPTSCENTHGQRGGRGSHGVPAHARACYPSRASTPALDDIMCAAALRYSGGSTILHNLKGIDPTVHRTPLLPAEAVFSTRKPPSPRRKPRSRVELIFCGRTLQQIFQPTFLETLNRDNFPRRRYSIFFIFCAAEALLKYTPQVRAVCIHCKHIGATTA